VPADDEDAPLVKPAARMPFRLKVGEEIEYPAGTADRGAATEPRPTCARTLRGTCALQEAVLTREFVAVEKPPARIRKRSRSWSPKRGEEPEEVVLDHVPERPRRVVVAGLAPQGPASRPTRSPRARRACRSERGPKEVLI
jgi:hypothetical protein